MVEGAAATAAAPLAVNAVPIFCDIDYDTFNLDPSLLEAAITPRTRTIVAVHSAGQASDMSAILEVASPHNLVVLEYAAHAHGAMWNDCGLGTIRHGSTFSSRYPKT